MNRVDLSSMGQHEMPPPREAQVLFRSLLLLPVINRHAHRVADCHWCPVMLLSPNVIQYLIKE